MIVQYIIDKNGIQSENIYNFDETGFAMDLISVQKVITRIEYYSWYSILQSENCEWIIVIEAIYADSYLLLLYIIFKDKNYIENWFDNLLENWRFKISKNSWTIDKINLRWLQKLSILSTNLYIWDKYQLLILDNYSNYFISQFNWICTENNIILLYILLYFLYLFQLFDIEYFAVFKYIYSYFINNLICVEYNYINKFNFLADYSRIYTEIF